MTKKADNQKKGLLYPAFQKLYNALSSLEKFDKGANFFDNISYLDNFLSEYRNITFVLQKSLAHTNHKLTYEKYRDKYLVNDVGKWFVNKRNQVVKEEPFDLEKKISIVIYNVDNTITLPEQTYTIENDINYSTLIDSLKSLLISIGSDQVMFSTNFSFFERDKETEILDNLTLGIDFMIKLLKALKDNFDENCQLSNELEKKIDSFNFYRVPKNMLFTDDYVFHRKMNYFEKASRAEMGVITDVDRIPISQFKTMFSDSENLFENFVLLHTIIFQEQKCLMPTCLIIYGDETMRMLSFDSSIKTTTYRKFHEIAKQIENDGIEQIFYAAEMYQFENINNRTIKMDALILFFMDHKLQRKSYALDINKIHDMKYIIEAMVEENSPVIKLNYFNAISDEFRRLKETRKN